ncbi:glycosyltransferase family 32 protein [Lentibacillus sp. Marseille-P4043]|uniref:glycosyltransferase family 32 protein n=1 Tax=Lentibacillus sp. Marseille-P4043 TaxID=2040293 RepID=UPI000D0BD227|nr:glycosyltransferase [Lentibacillus sp. Marseille-P4043]
MLEVSRIPKRIHYCWFGEKEKPAVVNKCLKSWRKHLVDYEIIEWNEKNFNVNCNLYVKEAYESKKFAFVSDYVRVHALYNEGGIYLDTDVEVFQSFDDLLHHHSFWGFEQENYIATSTIGAEKGNELIKIFLDSYQDKTFNKGDGCLDQLTNVAIVTTIMKQMGVKLDGSYQKLVGLGTFYPQTYFSPYDYINCRKFITEKTYTIHHFYKSWLSPKERLKGNLKVFISRIIGGENIYRIRKAVSRIGG